MPTPGTVQLVTVASGVPTVGSGTVSTLDNIFNATNGPVDVKAASTLPAATDKALVATIRDPITIVSSQLSPLGQAAASASTPVVLSTDQFPIAANLVSGVISTAMTATTSTQLLPSPGGGLRNYITSITVSNSHATVGTDVNILDGATVIYVIPAAAVYGGAVISFPTPLRQPTLATAINAQNVTTGSSIKVSATGWKGA